MKLSEISRILNASFMVGETLQDMEIDTAFAADLMSDVLAFVGEGALLLTGLVNPLVIRTADMVDIKAIVYVRGKKPLEESVELARRKGIPLLCTDYIMFDACGLLHQNGVRGSVASQQRGISQ